MWWCPFDLVVGAVMEVLDGEGAISGKKGGVVAWELKQENSSGVHR